jgi:hypothetical protein
MFWRRAITVGAQRRTLGRSSHRRRLCIILVCFPIALVEIVGIYGVESMMGTRGKGVVVVGVRHRSVGVDVVVEMGCRSSGMRRVWEVMTVAVRHLIVKVGLGYRIGIAVDAAVVVVIVRMLVTVVRLEIGGSKVGV